MNKFLMLVAVMLAAGTLANAQSLPKTRHTSNQTPTTDVTPVDKQLLMLPFDELKWVVLPENKEMQFAPITGNHTKGPYTQMRRVRAGTDHVMHVHGVEITDVVISGLWYVGADLASAKNFGPGSVIVIPAGSVHVSGCRPGSDCVFYHEGKGKFDFKPLRPKILDRKSGN